MALRALGRLYYDILTFHAFKLLYKMLEPLIDTVSWDALLRNYFHGSLLWHLTFHFNVVASPKVVRVRITIDAYMWSVTRQTTQILLVPEPSFSIPYLIFDCSSHFEPVCLNILIPRISLSLHHLVYFPEEHIGVGHDTISPGVFVDANGLKIWAAQVASEEVSQLLHVFNQDVILARLNLVLLTKEEGLPLNEALLV